MHSTKACISHTHSLSHTPTHTPAYTPTHPRHTHTHTHTGGRGWLELRGAPQDALVIVTLFALRAIHWLPLATSRLCSPPSPPPIRHWDLHDKKDEGGVVVWWWGWCGGVVLGRHWDLHDKKDEDEGWCCAIMTKLEHKLVWCLFLFGIKSMLQHDHCSKVISER